MKLLNRFFAVCLQVSTAGHGEMDGKEEKEDKKRNLIAMASTLVAMASNLRQTGWSAPLEKA